MCYIVTESISVVQKMDFTTASFIVSLVGLVLALIVAIPTIRKLIFIRRPTLFLILDENVNLFNQISKSIDGLSITYQNTHISDGSYLIKAFICYFGQQDITKSKIVSPICFELPENSRIFDSKIIKTSDGLNVDTFVDGNKINFFIDLLKNKEYIYFEAFVEINPDIKGNLYKLNSRIHNVNNSKTLEYNNINHERVSRFRSLVFILIALIGLIFATDSLPLHATDREVIDFLKRSYSTSFYRANTKFSEDSIYSNFNEYSQYIRGKYEHPASINLNSKLELEHSILLDAIFKSDSLWKSGLRNEIDWYDISFYNIFKLNSDKIKLNRDYSVKYELLRYWHNLLYFLLGPPFFIYVLYSIVSYSINRNKFSNVLELFYQKVRKPKS